MRGEGKGNGRKGKERKGRRFGKEREEGGEGTDTNCMPRLQSPPQILPFIIIIVRTEASLQGYFHTIIGWLCMPVLNACSCVVSDAEPVRRSDNGQLRLPYSRHVHTWSSSPRRIYPRLGRVRSRRDVRFSCHSAGCLPKFITSYPAGRGAKYWVCRHFVLHAIALWVPTLRPIEREGGATAVMELQHVDARVAQRKNCHDLSA